MKLERAMERHGDAVLRLCYVYMKQKADAEDIFQTVFCRYLTSDVTFESEAHERAWLLRVTANLCKDALGSFFRRRVVSLEALDETYAIEDEAGKAVRAAVLDLPEKYRVPVYLHYFEGYTAREIGQLLGRPENTIYTWLARGREQLKCDLGGDVNE